MVIEHMFCYDGSGCRSTAGPAPTGNLDSDKGETVTWFRFKACVKCRGDLVLDHSDWLCLQCGTYYYTGLYQESAPANAHTKENNSLGEEKAAGAAIIMQPGYARLTGTGPSSPLPMTPRNCLYLAMPSSPRGSAIAATPFQI